MVDPTPSVIPGDSQAAPIAEALLALAPLRLPNLRKTRYQGDDLCVVLEGLTAQDQASIRWLYQALSELLFSIADLSTDDDRKWQDVTRWLEQYPLDTLIERARELGTSSHEQHSSEALARAMHDIRGGALSSLLGRLELIERLPHVEKQLRTLFVLTRDHLKIMRNAVTGLDDTRRDADRKPKAHAMQLMLDKWHDSVVGPNWQERPVRMSVDCRYEGPLTECCLESAAIDRIFYNLAANAARYSAGEQIEMTVFPVPNAAGECLRFVLCNEVSERQAGYLQSLVDHRGADSVDRGSEASLFALFDPAVSSTGSGLGLAVVAEFVAAAFGLRNPGVALRERYVGAVLDGLTFRVWFHWPTAHEGLPQKLDDYHHPQQSLSEP